MERENIESILKDYDCPYMGTDLVTGNTVKDIKVDGDKTLFVTSQKDNNTILSSRNLSNTKVITAEMFNTYDILHSNQVHSFN